MSVSEGFEADKKPNLKQQFINALDKYGVFALILFIFSACFGFVIWNAERFIDRADRQAEANLKIGQLESKVELLEKGINQCAKVAQPQATPNEKEATQSAR